MINHVDQNYNCRSLVLHVFPWNFPYAGNISRLKEVVLPKSVSTVPNQTAILDLTQDTGQPSHKGHKVELAYSWLKRCVLH